MSLHTIDKHAFFQTPSKNPAVRSAHNLGHTLQSFCSLPYRTTSAEDANYADTCPFVLFFVQIVNCLIMCRPKSMDEATSWIASNLDASQQQIAGQTVSEAKSLVSLCTQQIHFHFSYCRHLRSPFLYFYLVLLFPCQPFPRLM